MFLETPLNTAVFVSYLSLTLSLMGQFFRILREIFWTLSLETLMKLFVHPLLKREPESYLWDCAALKNPLKNFSRLDMTLDIIEQVSRARRQLQ